MQRLADWAHSLRVAARSLARAPGYALATILTIALGIAANIVVFSVARAVLLRPLPYPNADRLYGVSTAHAGADGKLGSFLLSDVEFLRWRKESRTLDLGALLTQPASLTGAGEPETISVGEATASLFSVLGVAPERGRTFSADEDVPNGPVAIVSHGFWVGHMGARPTAVGETIGINGAPRVVIGVMPPGFEPVTQPADVWIPFAADESHPRQPITARVITVIGRARPGATKLQINAELAALSDELTREQPDTHAGWTGQAGALQETLVTTVRPTIVALVALVGFLMLLVCANVANLTLARLASRHGEASVRRALGGGAWQLLRPAVAETTIIASLAAAIGLMIGALTIHPLAAMDGGATPLLATARVDGSVLGFTALITLVSAALSLGIPAARALHRASAPHALSGGPRATHGKRERFVARTLMSAQIALALVLAVGATAVVRELATLTHVSPGFDAAGVTAMTVTLPPERYPDHAARAAFADAVLREARVLPGITAVSGVTNHFLPGNSRVTALTIDGRPAKTGDIIVVNFRRVGTDYFSTMRIPLSQGRRLEATDRTGSVPVVVISRSLARAYWPGEDPVGKHVTRTVPGAPSMTVVGVVDDVHDAGLGESVANMIYAPYAQLSGVNPSSITIVARSPMPMSQVSTAIRSAVHRVDPLLPVDRTAHLGELMSGSLSSQRFRSLLLGIIACLGLALASLGIYGVTSYNVVERYRELAVRSALGARPVDVMRLLMVEATIWISGGVVAGLGMTSLLSTLARTAATNPIDASLALRISVAAFVFAMAALATAMPARRAIRVSPAQLLRG